MVHSSMVVRGAGVVGCLLCLVFSAPAPASAGGVYFVKSGDTLTGISRLFGVTVDRIQEVNHLQTANISPGDMIRIPDRLPKPAPVAEVSRPRVVSSDRVLQSVSRDETVSTLTGISRLSGVAVDGIQEAHHLQTADIPPGDMILVSDKPPKPDPVVEVSRPREVSSERVLQAVCRDETVYHSVVRGDTLSAIANRYAMELDNLLQLNGLRKSARLAIGQKIVVRKNGPRSHTVARGETLTSIASRYGIEAGEIVLFNRLDGNKIAAGQRLVVEPCDPYAAAGSVPPPLGGPGLDGLETGGLKTTTSGSAAEMSQRVIEFARSMLNVPYRFGGSTLRGIDCSAYVQRVFGHIDLQIPRTAREQYAVGARIVRDDIQIGDLVFFRTYASYPSHVGIYLGENLFIHASSMVHKVAIDSMDRPYYRKRFIGARRLVVDDAPAVASTP